MIGRAASSRAARSSVFGARPCVDGPARSSQVGGVDHRARRGRPLGGNQPVRRWTALRCEQPSARWSDDGPVTEDGRAMKQCRPHPGVKLTPKVWARSMTVQELILSQDSVRAQVNESNVRIHPGDQAAFVGQPEAGGRRTGKHPRHDRDRQPGHRCWLR